MDPSLLHLAAGVGAVLLLGIAAFQVLLAIGLPLGEAAWGGRHRVLPPRLRIASAIAAPVWLLAAVLVLERAGVLTLGLDPALTRPALWVFTVLLGVGTVMNTLSRSMVEQVTWTPVAACAFGSCLVLSLYG